MMIDPQARAVELTRTNLLTLLSKLDGNPTNSACTLLKVAEGTNEEWSVKAVEDAEHYSQRPRGMMHPVTEAAVATREHHVYPTDLRDREEASFVEPEDCTMCGCSAGDHCGHFDCGCWTSGVHRSQQ